MQFPLALHIALQQWHSMVAWNLFEVFGGNKATGEACTNRCGLQSNRKKVLSDRQHQLCSVQLSLPVAS